VVEAVDENPCAEWLASVKLGHEYDQSGITMAMVLALSPRPAGPTHPPKTTVLAMAPESTKLAEAPAVAPPKAEPHQWQHAVCQS